MAYRQDGILSGTAQLPGGRASEVGLPNLRLPGEPS